MNSQNAGAPDDLEEMIEDGSIHELDPEKDFTWDGMPEEEELDDAGMTDYD